MSANKSDNIGGTLTSTVCGITSFPSGFSTSTKVTDDFNNTRHEKARQEENASAVIAALALMVEAANSAQPLAPNDSATARVGVQNTENQISSQDNDNLPPADNKLNNTFVAKISHSKTNSSRPGSSNSSVDRIL